MKLEQSQLELAARLFFAREPQNTGSASFDAGELPHVKLHRTYEANGDASLSMFMNDNGKGWVMLSSHTELIPVYADTDEDLSEMEDSENPAFDDIMKSYLYDMNNILDRIRSASGKNDEESIAFMKEIDENRAEWEKLLSGETIQRKSACAPAPTNGREYWVRCTWSQKGQYNKAITTYCKSIGGTESEYLLGCSAVALGQIVKTLADLNKKDVSFDGKVKYRWIKEQKNIEYEVSGKKYSREYLDTTISAGSSKRKKEEVNNFLKDLAIMLESDFGKKGTSAFDDNIVNTIRKYIKGGSCSGVIALPYEPAKIWDDVFSNLRNKKPILSMATNDKGIGHAFIMDGLDESKKTPQYHFNMGWGGIGNKFWGQRIETGYFNDFKVIMDIKIGW